MTNEKNDHRVTYLERRVDGNEEKAKDVEIRVRDLEKSMTEIKTKLPTILEAINELKANNKWMRQTLAVSLIGGVIGVIGSAIKWFIEH